MTHRPIPETRRRELAAFIPDLAEARLRHPYRDPDSERAFWTEHILGIRKRSPAFPTSAAEQLWLIRHAHLAVTGTDPIWVPGFQWPGFCARTGPNAVMECWPLEPIPGAKVPPKEPPKETRPSITKPDECSVVIEGRVVKPGDTLYVKASALETGDDPKRTVHRVEVDQSGRRRVWFTNGWWRDPTNLTFVAPAGNVERTSTQVFHDYMNRHMAELAMPQIFVNPTHPNPENTMNQTAQQATPANAHALTVDTANIVEVKTFVFGRDIATLDDDILLSYAERLTASIEHLEQLNAKTPLVKLVTKIAQLKDAKAKIVELLGGAPVEQASPAIDADADETKPKRVRRTKAEIEADNAAQARAETKAAPIPLTPPPASKVDPDPSADVDIDYNA